MTAMQPPLPELIAAWRKTYDRTWDERQAAGEPLLEWLDENRSACAPEWAEDVAWLLALAESRDPVLSILTNFDHHFSGKPWDE